MTEEDLDERQGRKLVGDDSRQVRRRRTRSIRCTSTPATIVAPDGKAGKDVYAVLREAIGKTGRIALSRVVIGQRERTIALRPMDGGLMAHTLHEERDLNSAKQLFESTTGIKTDPEMVQLAVQLIDRQTGRYDPRTWRTATRPGCGRCWMRSSRARGSMPRRRPSPTAATSST